MDFVFPILVFLAVSGAILIWLGAVAVHVYRRRKAAGLKCNHAARPGECVPK